MLCISTFYRFFDLENPLEFQKELKVLCADYGIRGTIILAKEGVNATIAGQDDSIISLERWILNRCGEMSFQHSYSDYNPFQRLKVKIKPEIVTLGVKDLDISDNGIYVDPNDWDELISNNRVKVIDTRNYYEVALGTFKNAISPHTNNFSDFIDWVENHFDKSDLDQPIAMFCTGGIRCEKSTAYMKKIGFKNVYHLKGGIIAYLNHQKNKEHLWNGSCFIFDERLMLDEKLKPV